MLKLLALFSLAILISCENAPRETSTGQSSRSIASTLKFQDKAEYIDSFNRYHYQYKGRYLDIDAITVTMVDKLYTDTMIGYCDRDKGEILLLESYWNYASHIEKEALIYHELGHCVLDREHLSGKLNSVAVSYMFPNITYYSYYDAYQSAYVEELFTNNLTPIKKILSNLSTASSIVDEKIHTCGNEH